MDKKKLQNSSYQTQVMNPSLEDELQEELNDGATEDDFVVQQLRRQIAAKKSGKTSEQLYVSGSVKNKSEIKTD